MKLRNATDLSDEELVHELIRTGNTDLFAVLYDRYADTIYSKCYGFSKRKEEAQDLTQDVFIKLFIKLRTFKEQSRFSTWLYSFTYNFCVNYIQRNVSRKNEKVTIDSCQIKESYQAPKIDDVALFELKSEKLAKAMKLLEPNDRTILVMKYQDELTIEEIKELLDLSESAVKMRLKRAREKVVKIYHGCGKSV